MARPKGSKNKTKVLDGVDYAAQIAEKNTAAESLAEEIAPRYNESGAIILDGRADATQVTRISKARVGDYICDLTPKELELIDAAVARELDLMHHYVDIKKKLIDKTNYAERVVKERNEAQDEIKEIKNILVYPILAI